MNSRPNMPATTAAPMVPPEIPLSEELEVVADCALPLLVLELLVLVAVEVPAAVLVLPVDVDMTASLL